MSVIQGNAFSDDDAVDTGDIPASLRCRGAQYLSRTFTGGSATAIVALSLWVRRGTLGTNQVLLNADYGTAWYSTTLEFLSNDTLHFRTYYGNIGTRYGWTTTRVFRDPTAWVHLFLLVDTSQTGQAARRLWVDGVEELSFTAEASGYNTPGMSHYILSAGATNGHVIGSPSGGLDGYSARICGVVGSSTPSSFGYHNTEINEWVTKGQSAVKAVVDAGGANSFMLDFDDATSLTTLGYDKSSKGNNWTLNNFSLTAGSTYDHMLDVPGNSYAVLNPLFPTTNTISNGNLRGALAASTNAGYGIRSAVSMVSGKYEAEFIPASSADTWSYVGVCPATLGVSDVSSVASNAVLYRAGNGNKNVNGTATAYGTSWTTQAIRVAVDMDARTVVFYRDGVSQGSISLPSATENYIFVMANGNATAFTADANFGQQPITLDTGFLALCQANLQTPAILNPKLHFDIKTRTGTAATYSVTGIGFQPDLLWSKSRGRAVDHALYDSVRGVQKQLESNSTGAETTETTGLTAFNSDGYTGGALDQINGTTATNSFVDWLWKAGGAAVTNTAGSITSQVSANVEAGFSIVTYTGTGANATVGHGLTKVPKLVIVKQRTSGTVENWAVSHASIANTEYLLLNTTDAKTAGATYWNSTTPTTSVFSVGSAADTNESAKDFVAYCFADIEGYSKAFSYTGNGSADGPYVHLGFKPRYILIKQSSAAGNNWQVFDVDRGMYINPVDDVLFPNTAGSEGTGNATVDFLGNGFKIRTTDGTVNTSGATYIGFAFADVAGKYSLGR